MNDKAEIITLCGSTKFKDEFMRVSKELSLKGKCVLSVGCFGHSGDDEVFKDPFTKQILDDVHKQKILMSDSIYVINPGGYIGESTKQEIIFARKNKKVVYSLEKITDPIIHILTMKDREEDLKRIADLYKVEVCFNSTICAENSGSAAGYIELGKFDDLDNFTIAFFHELAHILSPKLLNNSVTSVCRLSNEGLCWEYGFELARQCGYYWDFYHPVRHYAYKCLFSYVFTEYDDDCRNLISKDKIDEDIKQWQYRKVFDKDLKESSNSVVTLKVASNKKPKFMYMPSQEDSIINYDKKE